VPVPKSEFDAAIARARSGSERIQFVGALLGRATEEAPIIVGGSAIEVYTSSKTSTLDIDIVAPRETAARAIESWGFVRRKGRVWRRDDLGMDIDLLGTDFTGSRQRIRVIATPYGPVRLSSVEDMLVKRLAELKHWQTSVAWRKELTTQIEILAREYGDQMDEEYLASIARRDDVLDVLTDLRARLPGRARSGASR
jgi:hypothetical protein